MAQAAVPTSLPTSPCVPARSAPATRRSPGTKPAGPLLTAPRAAGLPGRGLTWTGDAVAAGDATALTLHAPLLASVSLLCTRCARISASRARPPPDLRALPAPWLRRWIGAPRGPPPCIMGPAAPGTAVTAAAEAAGNGQGAEPSRGLASSSCPGPPLPLQPRPLARARRPSRLPDRSAQKVLLFTWRKPKRGKCDGPCGQGPKDWELPRPWE